MPYERYRQPLHGWLLSPYHTGSHQAWAAGYLEESSHQFSLLQMAGRFWKWRMQGGAIELANQARQLLAAPQNEPQVIIATDMVNLPAWLGILRRELSDSIPILLYMHEKPTYLPLAARRKAPISPMP